MVTFIDQLPSDVRYAFIEHEVDLHVFNVLQQATNYFSSFLVTAAVLTESHAISVKKNGESASEICACTNIAELIPELEKDKLLNEITTPIEINVTDNFSYTFIQSELNFNERDRWQEVEQKKDNQVILSHTFPTSEDCQEAAKTIIKISELNNVLTVETIHTYPNVKKYIYTKSTWQ